MRTRSQRRLAILWPDRSSAPKGTDSASPPEVYGRLRPILLRVLVPSIVIALVMTALTFVWVPPFLTNAHSVFTPTQINAIAAKEQARQLALQQAQGIPQYGAVPSGMFAPYSTRLGSVTRTDSVNVFFGGVGSPWDVAWDMTEDDTYSMGYDPGNRFATGTWENFGAWYRVDNCENPQHLSFGSGPNTVVKESELEVVSRPCGSEDLDDISRFHMRIWDGGHDSTHGNWSVGTAHWDPDDDHSCGSFLFEEAERNVVEAFLDEAGSPLWFVADIWQFPVDGATSTELPDPDDPGRPLAACANLEAAPPEIMHYRQIDNGDGSFDYVEDPQGVPAPPGTDVCPTCPSSNAGLNIDPGGDGWGSDQPDGVAHYILLVA